VRRRPDGKRVYFPQEKTLLSTLVLETLNCRVTF